MPNITETISLLDKLSGKIDEYDWDKCTISVQEIGSEASDNIRILLVELYYSLPALRQAALDGERYRKAGETLEARLGEHAHTSGLFPEKDCFICNALIAYRQAVEQKEV